MGKRMTPDEQRLELHVAYLTALGRMCEDKEPTDEQKQAARTEANEHVANCVAAEAKQNRP